MNEDPRYRRIANLQTFLRETDYIVIKHAEGREVTDYEQRIAEREAWRAEIRELEEELKSL